MKFYKDHTGLNIQLEKEAYKKIVFTNGVFDILHPGHIELFEFAKSKGDIFIVGINTDQSVKRIKGGNRPIFCLAERIEVLEAIETIDFIISFSEDTPLRLIQSLYKIDILIKGEDYSPSEVVGRKEIEAFGGQLILFPFKSKYSTTSIIQKISP
ncbi:MAG: adenylyltransferase/cytidyltransferase family protein [Candidatus Aminicenantes bacterium]|nr:adenylyltransferase/cytidyltransferase family protein [Candidatus Aminicenantes bacterium]